MCSFGERSAITTYFHIVIINRHSFIHAFINIITLLVVKCQNPSSVRIFLTPLGYLVVLYVFSFLFLLLFRSLASFLLRFFIIDKDSSSHPSSLRMLIVLNPSSFLFLFVFLFIFFFPFWSFSFIVNLVVL